MYSGNTKIYYRKTVFTKPVLIERTTFFFAPVSYFLSQFTFLPLGDASVCSEKMAAPREKSFYVLEYHTVSLWLLYNVHFVHSTQRTRRQRRPRDLADLNARIIAAVKNIDSPTLTRVWQEIEYRIAVCRVTRGAHIEHL